MITSELVTLHYNDEKVSADEVMKVMSVVWPLFNEFPIVIRELYEFTINPSHQLFKDDTFDVFKVLYGYKLIDENGNMDDSVRYIVLSAVIGGNPNIIVRRPIKD